MNRTAGLILTVVGLVVMIWGGFGFTTREKVLDIGPIEATKETTRYMPYAPVIGGIIFAGGLAVLIASRSRSAG